MALDLNLSVLKWLSREGQLPAVDQGPASPLRTYIASAASHLLLDSSGATLAASQNGIAQWTLGFNRIMDVVAACHASSQLELATVVEVRDSLCECYGAATSLTSKGGTEAAQEAISQLVGRLARMLEHAANGVGSASSKPTFKGTVIDLSFV